MKRDDEADDRPLGEYLNLPEPGDRGNALLTESQREFLYDPTTVSESSGPTIRQRLRDRIRAGLQDFEYMRAVRHDDLETVINGFDPAEQQHLITTALRVFWDLSKTASDIEFESALEQAIRLERPRNGRLGVRDVTVDIDVDRFESHDVEELKEKLEAGERLTDPELGFLLRNVDDDEIDNLVEHARTRSAFEKER